MKCFMAMVLVLAAPASANAAVAHLKEITVVEPESLRPQVQSALEAMMPRLNKCVPAQVADSTLVEVRMTFDGQGGSNSRILGEAADRMCFGIALGRFEIAGLTTLTFDVTFETSAKETSDAANDHVREVNGFCAIFTQTIAKAASGAPMKTENLFYDAALAAGYESDSLTFKTHEWLHAMLSVNPADIEPIYKNGVQEVGGDPSCPALEKWSDDVKAGKTMNVNVGSTSAPPPSKKHKRSKSKPASP